MTSKSIFQKYVHLPAASFERPVTFIGVLLKDNKVEQYRGIQFASLTKRWSRPILINDYSKTTNSAQNTSLPRSMTDGILKGSAIYNATQYGPISPQPPEDINSYYAVPSAIVRKMPASAVQDEFNSLNLVITKPASSASNLPVVVFIHGGSNATGSNCNPLVDGATLVQRASDTGKPIIMISIQYRLGALGWMKVNGQGNWGFRDQQAALKWIKLHVKDFGGDSENITVLGLSAGSCNTFYQSLIKGNENLFNKVALMSGVANTTPLRSPKVQELMKQDLAALLFDGENAAHLTETKLDAKLFTVPVDDLITTTGLYGPNHDIVRIWYGTKDDQEIFPIPLDTSSLPSSISSALLSDTFDEGLLFTDAIKHLDPEIVKHQLSTSLSTELTNALYHYYDLDSNFQKGMEALFADLIFAYPIHTVLKKEPRHFRLYFDTPNPFDNSLGSMHGVDMLYLFGNYLTEYPPDSKEREVSRNIQDSYIRFFYTGKPWDPNQNVYRFSENFKGHFVERGENKYRRENVFEKVFDKHGVEEAHKVLHVLSKL